MNASQIEKSHPELKGLSHETQLRILEKARRETPAWKQGYIWLTVIAIGAVCGLMMGVMQSIFPLKDAWGTLGFVVGSICSLAVIFHYEKIFRLKVAKLAQNEKQYVK